MLTAEFIDRTGYVPSAEEWADIEDAYYGNDLNKDDFCRLWARINARKVTAAREAKKAQEREWNEQERTISRVLRWARSRAAHNVERLERDDVRDILKGLDVDISREVVRKMHTWAGVWDGLALDIKENVWKLRSAVCYGY